MTNRPPSLPLQSPNRSSHNYRLRNINSQCCEFIASRKKPAPTSNNTRAVVQSSLTQNRFFFSSFQSFQRDLRQLQQQKKPPKIGKPAASGQAKKKKVSEIPVRLATKVSASSRSVSVLPFGSPNCWNQHRCNGAERRGHQYCWGRFSLSARGLTHEKVLKKFLGKAPRREPGVGTAAAAGEKWDDLGTRARLPKSEIISVV